MAKLIAKINIADLKEFKDLLNALVNNYDNLPKDVKLALSKFKDKEG